MRAQVLLGDQVLAFARGAVDHRDGVVGSPGPHPPREPARQPHQVGVVQHRIRPGLTAPDQAPPPGPEPARRVPHRVVGIQHDPVHAVIPASQQIPVPLSEVIGHPPTVEATSTSYQDITRTAPEGGHSFRAKSRTERSNLPILRGRGVKRLEEVQPGAISFLAGLPLDKAEYALEGSLDLPACEVAIRYGQLVGVLLSRSTRASKHRGGP